MSVYAYVCDFVHSQEEEDEQDKKKWKSSLQLHIDVGNERVTVYFGDCPHLFEFKRFPKVFFMLKWTVNFFLVKMSQTNTDRHSNAMKFTDI